MGARVRCWRPDDQGALNGPEPCRPRTAGLQAPPARLAAGIPLAASIV